MAPIRVLIADDHPVVRSGLRGLLERLEDIEVVAEAGSGEAALRLAGELRPDVLLLDMEMPGLKGYEVARRIRQACLPVSVLVLTAYDDREYIQGVLALGVEGYLLKDESADTIVEAIRQVAQGRRGWVSPRVMARLAGRPPEVEAAGSRLTARELQVLEGVVASCTNQEIAQNLNISPKTVEKHLVTIYEKLGVSSRVEAAVLALREGLVT